MYLQNVFGSIVIEFTGYNKKRGICKIILINIRGNINFTFILNDIKEIKNSYKCATNYIIIYVFSIKIFYL